VSEQNRLWWREGERHRWSGGRAHRLARADERTRRSSEANVGVFRGETMPDDEIDILRERLGLTPLWRHDEGSDWKQAEDWR
jgi:hypothetical protein